MTIAVISMIRDSWGGSEELWGQMAALALKKGHQVIHLAYETKDKHPKITELERSGLISLHRPGLQPTPSPVKRMVSLGINYIRKKLNDPIEKLFAYKPDIVIYNGTCYSINKEKSLLRKLENRNFKFYLIGHLNHDLIRDINDQEAALVRLAYHSSDKVFFVSNRNKETAERHLCTAIHNAEIIRNPVNMLSTEPIPFPSTEKQIQMAMVGNLATVHKGQDLMIQALSKWETKNWTLNIYGTGPDRHYLENLAAFLGLKDQVIFHGTTRDIRKVWEQNHLLLMPSHMEGMPLAVVEAMLCGRLCLATNVGGHKEWITDEENGYIAEAPAVDALLNTLQRAIKQKDKWPEMAHRAHEKASLLYNPNAGETLLNRIIAE